MARTTRSASGKADGGIDEGSPEALGVLALVNDPAETAATLKAGAAHHDPGRRQHRQPPRRRRRTAGTA